VPGLATATATQTVQVEATRTLELPSSLSTPTLPVMQVCTGIPGGKLNLRACARLDCEVIDLLDEGTPLDVLEEQPHWMHITRPADGWVNSKYVCRK